VLRRNGLRRAVEFGVALNTALDSDVAWPGARHARISFDKWWVDEAIPKPPACLVRTRRQRFQWQPVHRKRATRRSVQSDFTGCRAFAPMSESLICSDQNNPYLYRKAISGKVLCLH